MYSLDEQTSDTEATASRTVVGIQTNPWWQSPLVIIGLAALLRVLGLLFIEGDIHDGTTRVGIAARWLFDGESTFGRTMWPEGNYVLPGLALAIWNEPFWSVRSLFALVGLSNVYMAMRLAREVFDTRTGAVCGWAIALMPFHVLVSANGAMSETPYISCVLFSLVCIVRYRKTPSAKLALFAGLGVAAASTFRIDGVAWGLPLAASFVVLRERDNAWFRLDSRTLVHLAIFGIVGLVYLGAVFSQWAQLYDSPFYILDQAKLNTHQFLVGGRHPRWPTWFYHTYVVAFWPASTFAVLTPLVAMLAWLGVFHQTVRMNRRAVPLVLGLAIIMAWLGYAAFKNDILTQFRYGLVLAVVLACFIGPGAAWVRGRSDGIIGRNIALVSLTVGVIWASLVGLAARGEYGILTRQLTVISPIRRSQYATRGLLNWISANGTAEARIFITAHVMESPFLALHRKESEQSGRLLVQSYYLPERNLVHSRVSLVKEMREKLERSSWVATSLGSRQLGLRDGLVDEIIKPIRVGSDYVWEGVKLRPAQRWGDVQLWQVMISPKR